MKIIIPPIKSQGIKTKLVPWIESIIPQNFKGRWIEPFMGTGVVAFNCAPNKAILCDTNPHLINFYKSISENKITADIARDFLLQEGNTLINIGEKHFYYIRDRFNSEHNSLDFLFLNRSCFNGMIRFNRKGGFNVPFCRKPQRFAQAYITKISNQISSISKIIQIKNFEFKCQGFEKTIEEATSSDIIYCDPPYIDRHADYYNGWNHENEIMLNKKLSLSSGKFILSTWHSNQYRKNEYINNLWHNFNINTQEHFYHIGGYEKNRSSMLEALITNYDVNCNFQQNEYKNVHFENFPNIFDAAA